MPLHGCNRSDCHHRKMCQILVCCVPEWILEVKLNTAHIESQFERYNDSGDLIVINLFDLSRGSGRVRLSKTVYSFLRQRRYGS